MKIKKLQSLHSFGQIKGMSGLSAKNDSKWRKIVSNTWAFKYLTFHHDKGCHPEPHTCDISKPVVPNIVHYIWLYKQAKRFEFCHLISVLSALRIQVPDEVWFWYDKKLPVGQYWEQVKAETNRTKIPFILRKTKTPTHISGQKIKYSEHSSDIMRLIILSKYGGIYLDSDMIILRDLKPLMCYNHTQGRAMSATLANSFIMAAPGSEFLNIWMRSYHSYKPKYWSENSVVVPLKLALKNQDKIHVEPRCILRPNMNRVEKKYLFNENLYFNWSEHYSVHVFLRFYRNLTDEETIKWTNNTLSQIFYYIYYKSKRNDTL